MDLAKQFYQHCQKNAFFQPTDYLLIAVSGGVDSMVLLDLMRRCFAKIPMGVVHFNHQLRESAEIEQAFIKEYCQTHQLPFFTANWQEKATTNLEARARKARYRYFAQVMKAQGFTCLLTAHHGDDQLETMLMKLVKYGNFQNLAGMKAKSVLPETTLPLCRPLLFTDKKTLYDYAHEKQLTYFEDETNQSLAYARNRMRHQVLPVLKGENPQALNQVARLSERLYFLQEILEEMQDTWYDTLVRQRYDTYQILLEPFLQLTPAKRYFALQGIFHRLSLKAQIPLKEAHVAQVLDLLAEKRLTFVLSVENKWQIHADQDKLIITRQKEKVTSQDFCYTLKVGESIMIDAHRRVGLFVARRGKNSQKSQTFLRISS
ncbi:tRNA lysidine(34) synthetase TilS [Enterococcus cecorum]